MEYGAVRCDAMRRAQAGPTASGKSQARKIEMSRATVKFLASRWRSPQTFGRVSRQVVSFRSRRNVTKRPVRSGSGVAGVAQSQRGCVGGGKGGAKR